MELNEVCDNVKDKADTLIYLVKAKDEEIIYLRGKIAETQFHPYNPLFAKNQELEKEVLQLKQNMGCVRERVMLGRASFPVPKPIKQYVEKAIDLAHALGKLSNIELSAQVKETLADLDRIEVCASSINCYI